MLTYRYFLLGSLLVVLFSTCKTEINKEPPIVGVKIYNWEGDYAELFRIWRETGINTVFANPGLLADTEFQEGLRQDGIKSFLIFPVFFDTDILENEPGLYAIDSDGKQAIDDWVHFVCPTREDFRKKKIEQAKKYVKEIQPDAISIDFIRYFVFWERMFPDYTLDSLPKTCYNIHCVQKFELDESIAIPDTLMEEEDISDWIDQYKSIEWTRWKCKQITSMIAQISQAVKIIKPDILVNVHLVPWRAGDYNGAIRKIAGQDVTLIKDYADLLSPMTYSHMVKQDPEWIHSVVEDVNEKSSAVVIPSIQVSKAYLDAPLTLDEFSKCIEQALMPPSKGVVFWSWDHLAASPEKLGIVKGYFSE
ncbi:hypothetical protein ACFLU5_01470 [Bacteroidota bacterium]